MVPHFQQRKMWTHVLQNVSNFGIHMFVNFFRIKMWIQFTQNMKMWILGREATQPQQCHMWSWFRPRMVGAKESTSTTARRRNTKKRLRRQYRISVRMRAPSDHNQRLLRRVADPGGVRDESQVLTALETAECSRLLEQQLLDLPFLRELVVHRPLGPHEARAAFRPLALDNARGDRRFEILVNARPFPLIHHPEKRPLSTQGHGQIIRYFGKVLMLEARV